MVDASKKTKLMVGAAVTLFICGALYATRPTIEEVVAQDRLENDLEQAIAATPVSLTSLGENITPLPVAEKVEPTFDPQGGSPAETDETVFDPTGGHSSGTHLAIVRFCNAAEVETAWSIDVNTVRRYLSPGLNTEVLVLTYTTGDWLILSRSGDDYCYPIKAEFVGTGLQTIDALTAAQP